MIKKNLRKIYQRKPWKSRRGKGTKKKIRSESFFFFFSGQLRFTVAYGHYKPNCPPPHAALPSRRLTLPPPPPAHTGVVNVHSVQGVRRRPVDTEDVRVARALPGTAEILQWRVAAARRMCTMPTVGEQRNICRRKTEVKSPAGSGEPGATRAPAYNAKRVRVSRVWKIKDPGPGKFGKPTLGHPSSCPRPADVTVPVQKRRIRSAYCLPRACRTRVLRLPI